MQYAFMAISYLASDSSWATRKTRLVVMNTWPWMVVTPPSLRIRNGSVILIQVE